MPRGKVRARCGIEDMRVHFRRTGQQFVERVRTNGKRDRQPDCGPQRVAPADPIPHRQDAFARNAEHRRGAFAVCRDRIQARVVAQPLPQDRAVEQRLLRAETLGNQQYGGMRAIQPGQRPLYGGAVDIGKEVHAEAARHGPRQRIRRQSRTEIRTADANADDVGDIALREAGDELAHACAGALRLCMGLAHGRRLRQIAAQRGMQRRTRFGRVDGVAGEHGVEAARAIRRGQQVKQCFQRRPVVSLAREVGANRTRPYGEVPCPGRIGLQHRFQIHFRQALGLGLELLQPMLCGHGAPIRPRLAAASSGWCGSAGSGGRRRRRSACTSPPRPRRRRRTRR